MITEIPTSDDFEASAVAFLNLAWTTLIDLLHDSDPGALDHERSAPPGDDVEEEFWRAAQQPMANAAVLIQQGVEFLLKSRITKVSPFLLIAADPHQWPARSSVRDTAFADFRTLDAQDLPRVHDTVCPDKLSVSFSRRLLELRRTRNAIVHTVDKRVSILPEHLLVFVLEIHKNFLADRPWFELRRQYLESNHISALYGPDHVDVQLCVDSVHLLNALTPAQAREYLGVDKKRRWYICPSCTQTCRDADFYPKTAQLTATVPGTTSIDCFVCKTTQAVVRRRCQLDDCKGDVMHATSHWCLTCTEQHAPPQSAA